MPSKEITKRYSAAALREMRRRSNSKTEWAKVDVTTEAELEASIAADPDDVRDPIDWTTTVKDLPPGKEAIKLRIDADVLARFRATGKGYQTRMNNVLRAFVESRRGMGSVERRSYGRYTASQTVDILATSNDAFV